MDTVSSKLFLLMFIFLSVQCIKGAPLTNNNGTKPSELDGKLLRVLGIKLNLPKLRLIGKTIENIELQMQNDIQKVEKETARKMCDLSPCLEWTTWSQCSSNIRRFGTKSRTRQCSIDKVKCKFDSANSKSETEFGICGGSCPESYNITKNGFCLKLYRDKARTKDAAELQCNEDGGHLINIDSEIKYEDVGYVMQGFGSAVWIDGYRKDGSSAWKYTYGSQKGFFKWYTSQPSNGTTELCIRVRMYSTILWRDNDCSTSYYSMCEIAERM